MNERRHMVKNLWHKLTLKQRIWLLVAVLALILYLILTKWADHMANALSDQQAAKRWDESGGSAHVSCFFTQQGEWNHFSVLSFEKELEKKLKEVLSDEDASTEGGRRLVVDCYSSIGKLPIVGEKTTVDAIAVGIGGDFFLFHPLQLLSGAYFSGNDLMQDAVVLDENAAWQLFGSYDIAGRSVMIGGVPHYVSGVVKQEQNRFAQNAGISGSIVYVSYETLVKNGGISGIDCYEVLSQNPVRHFLYDTVKEKLGVKEEDMVVVENSGRYTTRSLVPIVLEFGSRSMQNAAVRFPYWENIARGYEDILALIMIFRFLLLVLSGSIIFIFLLIKWRHRNFSAKEIWNRLMELKEKKV